MTMRGIRGATTIEIDQAEQVLSATSELLEAICSANSQLQTTDIASALFTMTADIASANPARAARQLGWDRVPMMCAQEIPIPGGLPRCIRVLIHWNTDREQAAIHHIYLREAVILRPDLAKA
jgi:chorismate mutase